MPSPALRFSNGREIRAGNHKRGRSLEGGLLLRVKDDDLALFNELQTRERDNLLLHTTDDLDEYLSTKLRLFSDFKLGISIPVRGQSSDLLNADSEKNDYDWLLTPPDTPLFSSLDDDTPVYLDHRGKPRTQPISISRSSTMEKSYGSGRSSASPHRLSPSPRSRSSTFQSRGRPSSTHHSSSSPILRPTTPSRRPSTSPNKPSTPAPRSSTPTSRRMSAGSNSTVATSGRRGSSPVKSCANSASPKLQAWQSNIPGFSMDAPPNLRTSLTDRPASYVRGTSPSSRNGRVSPSKFGRQSVSPTSSKSPSSSSYSFDRDRFSSQSKGSVASSGVDDTDSLQSATTNILDHSATRKVRAFPNSKTLASSRKPSQTLSSSAPKRSLDFALRQMDRKNPQNMFRPLLSSVPSTTFYVDKGNSAHRNAITGNSITTSSNGSSEQGRSVPPDTEDSDHDQSELVIKKGKAPYPDAQDEVFIIDEGDIDFGCADRKPNIVQHDFDRGSTGEVQLGESEKISRHDVATEIVTIVSKSLYDEGGDLSGVACLGSTATCSKCGRKFRVTEPMEENDDICPDCCEKGGCITVATPDITVTITQDSKILSDMTMEESDSCEELEPNRSVPESQENTRRSAAMLAQHVMNVEQGQSYLLNSSFARSMVEEEQCLVNQKVMDQPMVDSRQCDWDTAEQKLKTAHPSLKVDVSDGAGISVLLKRSSSSTLPFVQGRPFTATNIPCDDPSFARDSLNTMRSSIEHCSPSASSVDLSSSKQTEVRIRRQLSGRKADMVNSRHDFNAKSQSRGSSCSGISSHAYQALLLAKGTGEENFDDSFRNVEFKALEEIPLVTEEQCRALNNIELDDGGSSFIRTDVDGKGGLDQTESCRIADASALELSSRTPSIWLEDTSVAELPNNEVYVSYGNTEDLSNNVRIISDVEVPVMAPESSFIEEDVLSNSSVCGVDIVEVHNHGSSVIMSEELEKDIEGSPGCVDSPNSKITADEQEPSHSTTSVRDASVFALESGISDRAHVVLEESTLTLGGPGGHKRSLTLEEATDMTLFCRSIVHDLVYHAATTGMEKNSACLEGSSPTVTILGKFGSDSKDPHSKSGSKRTPKSHKVRQRQVKTEVKIPAPKDETDLKTHESLKLDSGVPSKIDSRRPPKLESKCNCTVM